MFKFFESLVPSRSKSPLRSTHNVGKAKPAIPEGYTETSLQKNGDLYKDLAVLGKLQYLIRNKMTEEIKLIPSREYDEINHEVIYQLMSQEDRDAENRKREEYREQQRKYQEYLESNQYQKNLQERKNSIPRRIQEYKNRFNKGEEIPEGELRGDPNIWKNPDFQTYLQNLHKHQPSPRHWPVYKKPTSGGKRTRTRKQKQKRRTTRRRRTPRKH